MRIKSNLEDSCMILSYVLTVHNFLWFSFTLLYFCLEIFLMYISFTICQLTRMGPEIGHVALLAYLQKYLHMMMFRQGNIDHISGNKRPPLLNIGKIYYV